jgi:hypothetical protein
MLSDINVFVFTNVSEKLALLYGDFGMNSYSVNDDDAMRQGNEALNLHSSIFQKR